MKKNHLAESTIKVTGRRLRLIAKTVNLNDPDKVTEYLANKQGKSGYINSLATTYERYTRYNQIVWKKPRIKRNSQPPYIPTTEETSILIANAGKKYSLILRILRDTGMRPIELQRLKLRWLDLNRGTVNVETAKGGNPRTLALKSGTLAMLRNYLAKKDFNLNSNLFPPVSTMRAVYGKNRKRTAKKLQKPELQRISMYSFRHYFTTMLYHKTKEILLVKRKLGHRRLETTLIYTHLVDFRDDEYTVKTAESVKEACDLIEVGFEYVTHMDGIKLFRKPKQSVEMSPAKLPLFSWVKY